MPVTPGLKVEMAFGSGFADIAASRTWTDVTAYVRGVEGASITRGRSDEQSQPSPSTCTLTLENTDGRFTPAKTGGAYYPNIVKGVPIRVSAVYGTSSYVRFTGYVNEWPVAWPYGGDTYSTVTITCSSRSARLGNTSPLPSAIRAAYLADNPEVYWPMDETEVVDEAGRFTFRDITNPVLLGQRETEHIGSYTVSDFTSDNPPIYVYVGDGTAGPTDEGSLVHLVQTQNPANPDWIHYIGGANVMRIGTDLASVGATFELVARVTPRGNGNPSVDFARLFTGTTSFTNEVRFGLDTAGDGNQYLYTKMLTRNTLTGATIEDSGYFYTTSTLADAAAAAQRAMDGEIHHYLIYITDTFMELFLDGALVAASFLSSSAITGPLRTLAMGARTLYADEWIGHAAGYDLLVPDPAIHATAATTATESLETRVTRLATYLGVPAAEVDVEASVAADLGPQPEKGRSASEVINEIAQSTGGVAFDARDGIFTMQSRNHRYGATSAFTLTTDNEQIEPDLTPVLDDRYLVNHVEVSRVGATDAAPLTLESAGSIANYGLYSQSVQMVSSEDSEAEAFGYDQLYRYAEPRVRVSQVSADVGDLAGTSSIYGAGVYGAGLYPADPLGDVLTADIGTKITLSGLPVQAPSTSMDLFVEGYTESISTPGGHRITFNTTPATAYQHIFTLDDPVLGRLDVDNVIAY